MASPVHRRILPVETPAPIAPTPKRPKGTIANLYEKNVLPSQNKPQPIPIPTKRFKSTHTIATSEAISPDDTSVYIPRGGVFPMYSVTPEDSYVYSFRPIPKLKQHSTFAPVSAHEGLPNAPASRSIEKSSLAAAKVLRQHSTPSPRQKENIDPTPSIQDRNYGTFGKLQVDSLEKKQKEETQINEELQAIQKEQQLQELQFFLELT